MREPQLLTSLCGKGARQISAGKTHSATWSSPSPAQRVPGIPYCVQLGTPSVVPAQYTALKDCDVEAIRARLRLLYHFSDLVYSSWKLFNLTQTQASRYIKFIRRVLHYNKANYNPHTPD